MSRDDVLAATTDYPEAREILQALGRKRLMEVRSINKKHAKHVSERESIASKNFKHRLEMMMMMKLFNKQQTHPPSPQKFIKLSTFSFSDKLRSDVKGIKNVLKRSRWYGRKNFFLLK